MAYWTFKFPKYFQDINLWSLNLNTLFLVIIASFTLYIFFFNKLWKQNIIKVNF